MTKAERKRRKNRDANRRYRAKKAQAALTARQIQDAIAAAKAQVEAEQKRAKETARQKAEAQKRKCAVCGQPSASFVYGEATYCAEHGKLAAMPKPALPPSRPAPEPALPPVQPRRDPLLFDPSGDKFRPAFWDVIDPHPEPIRLSVDPRQARISPPFSGEGQVTVSPIQAGIDLGVIYTAETGHVDIAQKLAEKAAKERETRR